ncbi:MAG: septum formation protein Maf [Caldilinea sp.]|nr:septum formation protein Maf [Caldilinea sp.]
MHTPPALILASASQRRQQFLRDLGLTFTISVADIDETPLPGELPAPMTVRLAAAKARAVAERLPASDAPRLVIASDTTVALGDTILGKPLDGADATRMLQELRGRDHEVISAVSALRLPHFGQATCINRTTVTMRDYSDDEIEAYVATGDPMDKAGAYGIQSRDFAPVVALDGCYAGVMGLPLADFCDLLAAFGVQTPVAPHAACLLFNTFACCAASERHSAHIDFDTSPAD